jgi:hypothetical protein
LVAALRLQVLLSLFVAPENGYIPTLRPGFATARFSDNALMRMLCYCSFNILMCMYILGVAALLFAGCLNIVDGRKVFKDVLL